jgi:hypothetical protein
MPLTVPGGDFLESHDKSFVRNDINLAFDDKVFASNDKMQVIRPVEPGIRHIHLPDLLKMISADHGIRIRRLCTPEADD